MNSKILNSILNGELKPWLISFEDERILKAIIQQVKNKPNETTIQVQANLYALLEPFPALLKGLELTKIEQLQPLGFSSNLTTPVSLINHFYKAIIDAEVARYFNATIRNPLIKDKELDVPYQIGHQSLKGIVGLSNQANNEIIERGFEANNTAISEVTYFALTYLRNSLLTLYFAIQEPFIEYLTITYSNFDDYALYCLDDSNFDIGIFKNEVQEEIVSIAKSNNKPFNFGFKGDEAKLKIVIKILCVYKNLLDESVTSQDDFTQLLLTKNISDKVYNIQIGCETNLFQHIVDQLKVTSPKFTYANIGKCNYFKTKNGNPIQASLLSNSKSNNPVPKKIKEEIDKIFKENDM